MKKNTSVEETQSLLGTEEAGHVENTPHVLVDDKKKDSFTQFGEEKKGQSSLDLHGGKGPSEPAQPLRILSDAEILGTSRPKPKATAEGAKPPVLLKPNSVTAKATPDIRLYSDRTSGKTSPLDKSRNKLLDDLPKLSRAGFYQRVATEMKNSFPGGLEAYAAQRYGQTRGRDVHSTLKGLGKGFDELAVDPGLCSPSHLDEFKRFVETAREDPARARAVATPWEAREAFCQSKDTVYVYRGLSLASPEEARTLQAQGLATKVERARTDNPKNGHPVPDLSELDTKPMEQVTLHHIFPGDRKAGRLSPLRQAIDAKGKEPTVAAEAFILGEDFPQSISHDPKVSASVAAGVEAGGTSEASNSSKTVYVFILKMSEIDVIKPSDYMPAGKHQQLPDEYVMTDPKTKSVIQTYDMQANGDFVESMVMSRIHPSEIADVKAWQPGDIPKMEARYHGVNG